MEKQIECHCRGLATRYFTRKFINMYNHKIVRVFYKCSNCGSKTAKDSNSFFEKAKYISILDLDKQVTNGDFSNIKKIKNVEVPNQV